MPLLTFLSLVKKFANYFHSWLRFLFKLFAKNPAHEKISLFMYYSMQNCSGYEYCNIRSLESMVILYGL